MEYGAWSLVPPLVAIVLAIATRQVIVSLLLGVYAAWLLVAAFASEGFNPLVPLLGARDTISALVDVFAETWQTRVIIFTMLMGSLLILMQRSGGVQGFVTWVGRWRWAHTRVGAQLMAWLVGLGVFIESTITCLVVGTVSRPLFDRLKISREKLAYICDSTSAPVCILLPINGWGATVLGLLAAQQAAGNLGELGPLQVFVAAVPLNFYAIISVLLVLMVVLTGWDIGPMRKAERRARDEGKVIADDAMPVVDSEVIMMPPKEGVKPRLGNMMIPLLVMLFTVPIGIVITGWVGWADAAGEPFPDRLMGLLGEASGSLAVLWGVCAGVGISLVMLRLQRAFNVHELVDLTFKGAGGLIPLATIMMLAFAIGAACDVLGTGDYVAHRVGSAVPPILIAPVVLLVAGFIAFSTGTSWGTFAIMMPLAVPLAAANPDVSLPLVVSAVLGGGVFGDHCSPISDTTVVSSMAAASDHIDHVRTQLPYALLAAGLACIIYLIVGAII